MNYKSMLIKEQANKRMLTYFFINIQINFVAYKFKLYCILHKEQQ